MVIKISISLLLSLFMINFSIKLFDFFASSFIVKESWKVPDNVSRLIEFSSQKHRFRRRFRKQQWNPSV
jgi:hypothetical protein